jgi:hypothetical protein
VREARGRPRCGAVVAPTCSPTSDNRAESEVRKLDTARPANQLRSVSARYRACRRSRAGSALSALAVEGVSGGAHACRATCCLIPAPTSWVPRTRPAPCPAALADRQSRRHGSPELRDPAEGSRRSSVRFVARGIRQTHFAIEPFRSIHGFSSGRLRQRPASSGRTDGIAENRGHPANRQVTVPAEFSAPKRQVRR